MVVGYLFSLKVGQNLANFLKVHQNLTVNPQGAKKTVMDILESRDITGTSDGVLLNLYHWLMVGYFETWGNSVLQLAYCFYLLQVSHSQSLPEASFSPHSASVSRTFLLLQ